MQYKYPYQRARFALAVFGLWLASCTGSLGNLPRSSAKIGSTDRTKDVSTSVAEDPMDGLSVYAVHCQTCHGPYVDLTKPSGLKKGNLIAPAAAVIKSSCPSLPALAREQLDMIVTVLGKLQKANPVAPRAKVKLMTKPGSDR